MKSSSYILLTGATGLLGRFLLRDLSAMGKKVAVLIRSSPQQSAQQRLDDILNDWMSLSCSDVETPVLISGELTTPGLDIDTATTAWIARNVSEVLHSAASLSFSIKKYSNEPFATNVEGTRHLLDFCKLTGIDRFHHISTAYVCGDRTGRILESELEVGQSLSNAYEESKLQAEQLVRRASFLSSATIFRPSIVIGDFLDGFTNTFHGFYAPLKFAQAFASSFEQAALDTSTILKIFGLEGRERKNFVTADWVSAAITQIILNSTLHGTTYHLTADTPTRLDMVTRLFAEMLSTTKSQTNNSADGNSRIVKAESLSSMLFDSMEPYKSYWRDDPLFDKTNTTAAIPNLRPPALNEPALRRLAKFALDHGCSWPPKPHG